MKKVSSPSKCLKLSPEHLATLEGWLLDSNLSFDDTLARATKELGFTGSRSGLHRFHQAKTRERALEDLADSAALVNELELPPGTENNLFHSGLKLLAQGFLNRAIADGTTDLPTLAGLLLQSEANEIRHQEHELRKQAQELRRQRLELDREKWELAKIGQSLDTAAKVEKVRPTDDDRMVAYAFEKRTNLRNRLMYGQLDWEDVLPENEEEDAAIDAWEDWETEKLQRQRAQLKKQSKTSPPMEETPAGTPAMTKTASNPSIPTKAPADPITKGPSSRDVPADPGFENKIL